MMSFDFSRISPIEIKSGLAQVIIDTPKGSRNKFKFDEEKGLFILKHILPAGAVFPFDFGFLPNTLTEDGDPLDVLVLLETPTFAGCLVETRIIGVLEAEQTEKNGQKMRNDRLIGVFAGSETHKNMKELQNLPPNLLAQIEHFFSSYNQMRAITFETIARAGSKKALQIIQNGVKSAVK